MTKPLKFPKGLQVQFISEDRYVPEKLFGVVVAQGDHDVIVRFPKWTDGWAHNDKGPENCWACLPHELKITEPTQTKLSSAATAAKPSQAYKGNGKHAWEGVTGGGAHLMNETFRLRVPGGWLYRTRNNAPAFVPMPEVVKHKV